MVFFCLFVCFVRYGIVGGNFSLTKEFRHLTIPIPYRGDPDGWPMPETFRDSMEPLMRSDHSKFWLFYSDLYPNGLPAVFVTDTGKCSIVCVKVLKTFHRITYKLHKGTQMFSIEVTDNFHKIT